MIWSIMAKIVFTAMTMVCMSASCGDAFAPPQQLHVVSPRTTTTSTKRIPTSYRRHPRIVMNVKGDGGGLGDLFKTSSSSPAAQLLPNNMAKGDISNSTRRERRRKRRQEQRRQNEAKVIHTASVSKFDMTQRLESVKAAVIGALSGGFAVTPVAFLHSWMGGGQVLAQWEFVTDMSSIEAALFAIVYRYAVRQNDDNPMLNQGVVGAFALVRTLSDIKVSSTCSAIPLKCTLRLDERFHSML
jgi:hypothetical protein